jgi:hypothetical protein
MRDKTRRPWKHGQAGAHVVAPHPLELRRTDERGKNTVPRSKYSSVSVIHV